MFKTKNYSAWEIDIDDFPDKKPFGDQIKFLLRYAILAPNGHNSQPWKFSIENSNVKIFIDPKRSLPKSDPTGKQLCISIGCLIENFSIAADFFGFEITVNYLNDLSGKLPIAKINLSKKTLLTKNPNHLINYIQKRYTNRKKYILEPLPKSFIENALTENSSDSKVIIVENKEMVNKIADLVVESQIFVMENLNFRNELSEMMKPNWTNSAVGMPGFAFSIPLPISGLSSFLVKILNMSKINKKIELEIWKYNTPAYFVILTKKDNILSWLQTGRLLEKIWLKAIKQDLYCAPTAAPIQKYKYQLELKKILGTDLIPQALARIGKSNFSNRHTPRLNVEQLLF